MVTLTGLEPVLLPCHRSTLAAELQGHERYCEGMSTAADIRAYLAEENPEALLLDGFDDALIGISRRCGQPALAVYDQELCIKSLMQTGNMDYETADEFFEFNVAGAWVGDMTPIILHKPEGWE